MVLSQNFFFLFVSLTSLAISELIEDACFQNLLLLLRGRGRGRLRYWRRGAWQGYKLLLWPVCLSHCFAVAIVIYFSFFIAWSSANKFLMSRRKRTKQNITEKNSFHRQLLDCRKLVALVARFVVNYKEIQKKKENYMTYCLGVSRPLMFLGRLISRSSYCFTFFRWFGSAKPIRPGLGFAKKINLCKFWISRGCAANC